MKPNDLFRAITEAERFLKVARQVKTEEMVGEGKMAGESWLVIYGYCKETAACKRASMDLTRALTELRR